jgi:hypothetical protein
MRFLPFTAILAADRAPMGPKEVRSTVLTEEKEASIVALSRQLGAGVRRGPFQLVPVMARAMVERLA